MITLKVEISVGSTPITACKEVAEISHKLNIKVAFDYNNIKCTMYPYSSAEQMELALRRAIGEGKDYAFSTTV